MPWSVWLSLECFLHEWLLAEVLSPSRPLIQTPPKGDVGFQAVFKVLCQPYIESLYKGPFQNLRFYFMANVSLCIKTLAPSQSDSGPFQLNLFKKLLKALIKHLLAALYFISRWLM